MGVTLVNKRIRDGHTVLWREHRLRWLKQTLFCCLFALAPMLSCGGGAAGLTIAYIPDTTVFISSGLRLPIRADDPDGGAIQFSVKGLPEAAQIIQSAPSEALLFWNPSITDTEPGGRRYDVTIQALNERGDEGETSFALWVLGEGGIPVFDLPSGIVVNLADETDVAIPVSVKDVDSSDVAIYMQESPTGAKFEMVEAKLGTFFWQPTDEQRKSTVHRVVFSAQDESHAPVTHTLTLVLLNAEEGVGCATTPPSILHTYPGDITLKDGALTIETVVADNESAVNKVDLYWRTGVVDGPFALAKMEAKEDEDGVWTATYPIPNVGASGALLHYYFLAVDNDDPFGVKCDRESRMPKGGVFTLGLVPEGSTGALCVDDEWMGNSTLQTAHWVETGSYYGMRLCGLASDWIRLDTEADQAVTVAVEVTQDATSQSPLTLQLVSETGAVLDEAVYPGGVLRVSHTPSVDGIVYAKLVATSPNARVSYSWKVSPGGGDCPSEVFEPNNSPGQATPLGAAPHEGLSLCPGDEDYFIINATGNKQVRVVLAFDHLYGDLDLELLDSDGTTVLAIGSTKTSNEQVVYTPTNSTTLYARVVGYEDAMNTYAIALTELDPNAECSEDPLAPNQIPEQAAVIYQGVYEGFQLCPGAGDWFAVDLNGGERLDVIAEPALTLGLNIHIYSDPEGTALATAALDADGWAWATLENAPKGRVYYRISGGLVPLQYTLLQDVIDPPGPCSPDRLEPNNHPSEATSIEEGVTTWARLCNGDQDFYEIAVPPFTTLTALTYHGWGAGWADLEIRDANGNVLGSGMDFGQGADAQVLVEDEGLIYVVVTGEPNVTVSYDLGVFLD